jgi:hypothetical protein
MRISILRVYRNREDVGPLTEPFTRRQDLVGFGSIERVEDDKECDHHFIEQGETMSEMIERVARALCGLHFSNGGIEDDGWDDCPEKFRLEYLDEARVAIEAMREPTDEMINALWAKEEECQGGGCGKQMFIAAIDAALAVSGDRKPDATCSVED